MDTDTCPKCTNRIGFSFGTCAECGWNHLDNTWHYIKASTDHLPYSVKEDLIRIHAKRIQSIYKGK